ncbi:hypothetical protein [Falsiroseomonas sp. E2-1-a20]
MLMHPGRIMKTGPVAPQPPCTRLPASTLPLPDRRAVACHLHD